MSSEPAHSDQRKVRGQFFTPPDVARFLVELLTVLAPGLRRGSATSAIDPACGQGVFLDAARRVLDPPPGRLVGVDLYPRTDGIWSDGDPGAEQVVGDGLLEPGGEERVDLVLGNPPFHSDALHCLRSLDGRGDVDQVGHARRLLDALVGRYELWRETISWTPDRGAPQLVLPGTGPRRSRPRPPRKVLEQLARYPAELAFLERFVDLCRPGGHVVIVLPEGVAANRRLQYVRDWVQRRCRVLGVVGLPRGTFRRSGTAAATTTLLLLRREREEEGADDPVLLLQVERLDRLDGILDRVRGTLADGGGDP